MKTKSDLNHLIIFKLAEYVKETMNMSNYHIVDSEKRSKFEELKEKLPKSVKNAVFASNVCIKSIDVNEYLYAAEYAPYDQDRRRIFTWIPGNILLGQGRWQMERYNNDGHYHIKNVKFDEYIYAAGSYFQYDAERRRTFTWRQRVVVTQSVWRIEPNGDDCHIKNNFFGEYLYPEDKHFAYDHDRRRVFTWIANDSLPTGNWRIEDCSNARRRRGTNQNYVENGIASSRVRQSLSEDLINSTITSTILKKHQEMKRCKSFKDAKTKIPKISHDSEYTFENSSQSNNVFDDRSQIDTTREESTRNSRKIGSIGHLFRCMSEKYINLASCLLSTPENIIPTGMQVNAMDINGTVILFDVLIRRITGQKYVSPNEPTSVSKVHSSALEIVHNFESILKTKAKRWRVSLKKFDFYKIYLTVLEKIQKEEHLQIPKVLYSEIKVVCPILAQNEKFWNILVRDIEKMLTKTLFNVSKNHHGRKN